METPKPTASEETLDQEEQAVNNTPEVQDAWNIARQARADQKEKRLEFIRRLMVRGIKDDETLIRLLYEKETNEGKNVDPVARITIIRYKAIVNKRNREEAEKNPLTQMSISEVITDYKRTMDEVTNEMWVQYHATKDPGTRKGILKEINFIKANWIKTLQSVGLADMAPQKVQYLDKDGNPTDPAPTNVAILNQQFNQFIDAKFKTPPPLERPTNEHQGS